MKPSIQCTFCEEKRDTNATVKGLPRLPSGWKRHNEHTYCMKCWHERYILRTITFPVVGPIDRDWSQLREALARAWKQSTELANWALSEFAKADVVRSMDMKKLPPMHQVYLYPVARTRIPEMASQGVAAVLRSVEQRYRKQRFAIVWLSEATLSPYRYPFPYAVQNQGWRAYYGENGEVLIDVPLIEGRYILKLKRGNHFRWQLAAFDMIVKGKAVKGELQIYRQRANSGDHRSGIEDRQAGGGARIHYRVMARLTAWLPRVQNSQTRQGTLLVHTDQDAFCVAEIEGQDTPWRLNGDHIKRWMSEHKKHIQRLWEDNKLKNYPVVKARPRCAERRAAFIEKHQRRINTWCHEVVAALANLADRQRVIEVCYNDCDHRFAPDFPWSRISTLLARKLEEHGIRLTVISGEGDDSVVDECQTRAA
jgi:hypothetical protein